jgi:hypothetical protein
MSDMPVDAEVQEQPEATDATRSHKNSQPSGLSNKGILIGASIGVLCLAAVLIGVLPDWKGNKKGTNDKVDTTTVTSARFQSSTGPFNVSIPLFSSDLTSGYENMDEAKVDFGEMAKFLLNGAIMDNVKLGVQQAVTQTNMSDGSSGASPESAMGGTAMADMASGSAPAKAVGDTVTDFGTNNQETLVDQADIGKSDGKFLFTAYGPYLIVLDVATGALMDEIEMKPIEYTPAADCQEWQDGIAYPAAEASKTNTTNETSASFAAGDVAMDMIWNPCFYKPTPYIQALAIDGDRVAVVVSGYGQEYTQKLATLPTIYEYLGTRILVYAINDGVLQLLSTKDVNGYFLNAFTINGYTHVVTQVSGGIAEVHVACNTVPCLEN